MACVGRQTNFGARSQSPPCPAASQHRVDWLDLSFGPTSTVDVTWSTVVHLRVAVARSPKKAPPLPVSDDKPTRSNGRPSRRRSGLVDDVRPVRSGFRLAERDRDRGQQPRGPGYRLFSWYYTSIQQIAAVNWLRECWPRENASKPPDALTSEGPSRTAFETAQMPTCDHSQRPIWRALLVVPSDQIETVSGETETA